MSGWVDHSDSLGSESIHNNLGSVVASCHKIIAEL